MFLELRKKSVPAATSALLKSQSAVVVKAASSPPEAHKPIRKSQTSSTVEETRTKPLASPSDITITAASGIGGESLVVYKLHKKILSAHSCHFQRIIATKVGDVDVLSLSVCDPYLVFPHIIKWMYDGKFRNWGIDVRVALCALAIDLLMPQLVYQLKHSLVSVSNIELVQHLKVASDAVDNTKISTYLIHLIAKRLGKCADQSVFYRLPSYQMDLVLRSSALEAQFMGNLSKFVNSYLAARERNFREKLTITKVENFRKVVKLLTRLQLILHELESWPLGGDISPAQALRDAKVEFYDRLKMGDGDLLNFVYSQRSSAQNKKNGKSVKEKNCQLQFLDSKLSTNGLIDGMDDLDIDDKPLTIKLPMPDRSFPSPQKASPTISGTPTGKPLPSPFFSPQGAVIGVNRGSYFGSDAMAFFEREGTPVVPPPGILESVQESNNAINSPISSHHESRSANLILLGMPAMAISSSPELLAEGIQMDWNSKIGSMPSSPVRETPPDSSHASPSPVAHSSTIRALKIDNSVNITAPESPWIEARRVSSTSLNSISGSFTNMTGAVETPKGGPRRGSRKARILIDVSVLEQSPKRS